MAALGIRKTAWQGLSDRDKSIVRFMGDVLALGQPAEYETGGGVRWFVFDDHRFKARHVAYFGCVLANLGDIPGGYALPMVDVLDEDGQKIGERLDKPTLRSQIKNFCENPARINPLVLPKDVVFAEDDPNPWQTLLDAQGTPSAVRMGSSVPDSWTAVSEDV